MRAGLGRKANLEPRQLKLNYPSACLGQRERKGEERSGSTDSSQSGGSTGDVRVALFEAEDISELFVT